MVATVNTNVMSLNAQRQLNKSQATSNQAMERLSSGLRINSAKDDAAGLAISTGMQSQIKGINQAVRNSNDGVSMAQTAEGSMDEMSNILQRMRELSVQSSNDTNSASNRGAIQKEVDQLHSELDRIASTTEFNGTKLLDGSSGETTLQIGANSGETLSFSIAGVTTNDLGLNGDLNKGDLNGGRVTGQLASGDMAVNGVDIPASASGSAVDVAKAINSKTGESGVSASAYNVVQGDHPSDSVTGKTDGMTIQVGNGEKVTLGATSSMDHLVETINRDVAGVSASLGDDGELLLTNDTGEDIAIGNAEAAGIVTTDSATLKAVADAGTVLGDAVTVQDGLKSTHDDAVIAQKAAQATYDALADGDKAAGLAALTAANDASTAAKGAFDTGVDTLATAQDKHDTDKKAALDGAPAEVFSGYVALDSADDTAISVTGDSASKAGFLESNGAGSITGGTATIGTSISKDDKLQINGVDIEAKAHANEQELLDHINSYSDQTGVTMSGTAADGFQFSSAGGEKIEITSGAATQAERKAALDKLGMSSEMGGKSIDALGVNVSTAEGASKSIEMIDKALGSITESRASLGAIQNRLGSTVSNLENVSQNLSAANSRIQDADFAAETSKMSKAQILQQAGTSMLSQANASAQSVLSMLG